MGDMNHIAAAAVRTQCFEDHNPQLYLALALLCKVSALVTMTHTEMPTKVLKRGKD